MKRPKTFSDTKAFLAGFTLIEILVAFAVIGMISGIGFLSFVSYSRRQIIFQAAANLKQAVELARFNSLSSVKPDACSENEPLSAYYVNFCTGTTCANDYEISVECLGEKDVESYSLPENVELNNVFNETPCTQIIFDVLNSTIEGSVPCVMEISGPGETHIINIDGQAHITYE